MRKFILGLSLLSIISLNIPQKATAEDESDWLMGATMSTVFWLGGNSAGSILGIGLVTIATCCAYSSEGNACHLPSQGNKSCDSARVNDQMKTLRPL